MKKRFLCIIALMSTIVVCLSACGESPGPMVDSAARRNVYLVLVNKTHEFPETLEDGMPWTDEVEICETENFNGQKTMIEQETYEQFKLLQEELLAQNIQIELDSAYRTPEDQQKLRDEYAAEYGNDYVEEHLAPPGYSEHHTGLAVDIFLFKNGIEIEQKDDMLTDKTVFTEIRELLPKYGFIMRYPEGKEEITGYTYEPWHLRYIGDQIIAEEIMNEDITLEEYLGETE